MPRLSLCLVLALSALLTGSQLAAETPSGAQAHLPSAARQIVFLGDSITYGGHYITFIETYFRTRHPERTIEFLNLGLPSETVSGLSEEGHADGKFPRPDLHDRLQRVLQLTQPDLVFACYGMNDGIYLPLSADRTERFQEGIRRLRTQVQQTGANFILITPPTYDDIRGGSPGYNGVLTHYASWELSQRSAGWEVIDLHGPMTAYLESRRQREPAFSYGRDGIHPDAFGHWIIAREILRHLGAGDLESVLDAPALTALLPKGGEILTLVGQRQRLTRDAWLSATGHARPGIKPGLPLPEAQRQAASLDQRLRDLLRP